MNVTIQRLRRHLIVAATAAALAIVGGLGLAVRANAAATPLSPRPAVLPAVQGEPEIPATVTRVAPVAAVVTATACETEQLTVLAPDC